MTEDDVIIGTKDYEDYLDKQVVVLLWEGKYLYGTLRSFDQYNSITLENTVERIFHNNEYAEKRHGIYVIRGENIVILGIIKLNLKPLKKVEYSFLKETIKNKVSSQETGI